MKKIDNEPRNCIFGVCKKKEADILLLHNYFQRNCNNKKHFFTVVKDNAILIRLFGLMYIGFEDYHPYTGAINEIFETNMNDHIKCIHGYYDSTFKGIILTCIDKEGWEPF